MLAISTSSLVCRLVPFGGPLDQADTQVYDYDEVIAALDHDDWEDAETETHVSVSSGSEDGGDDPTGQAD
jgi:hypothetical protein